MVDDKDEMVNKDTADRITDLIQQINNEVEKLHTKRVNILRGQENVDNPRKEIARIERNIGRMRMANVNLAQGYGWYCGCRSVAMTEADRRPTEPMIRRAKH